MFERTFDKATRVPGPQHEVFDWHTRTGAFERLAPPWDNTKLLEYGGIRDGQRVILKVWAPWPRKWVAVHEDYIEGVQFKDRQVKGPFPQWVHTHRVYPDPQGQRGVSLMRDHIEFKLPAGPLGALAYRLFMRKQIEQMFDHRHATLVADTIEHRQTAVGRKLTVALTGASGLIGRTFSAFLTTGGHAVRPVARRDGLTFDLDAIRGADVIVHLAGEPIAQRWNASVKDRIRRSRVDRTRLLCEQLARLPDHERPGVLLSGSATGVYGDRGDAVLTEDSSPGNSDKSFLADVAQGWEDEARVAIDAGMRVVLLRTGIVLTPQGGALKKMLPAFKLGLGGRLGGGQQYMSWVSIEDHIRIMYRAMFDHTMHGPVNVVAPQPVTNAEFTKTLAKVLRRPAVLPAPGFMLRRVFGEMADEALLSSQRVEPRHLLDEGFIFRHGHLETALRELLGRP
ncbi:MAG: TIGR01777 family oxidoreductase [Planctomycetota bacterium]